MFHGAARPSDFVSVSMNGSFVEEQELHVRKTKAKVARELGIRVNQLRQWRLDFEEEERNGVPKQGLAAAEQDVGKLRRENALLREENELLKKAAIYFAKVSR